MEPLTPEQFEKAQDAQIFYEQWQEYFKIALDGTASSGLHADSIVGNAARIAASAVTEVRKRKP